MSILAQAREWKVLRISFQVKPVNKYRKSLPPYDSPHAYTYQIHKDNPCIPHLGNDVLSCGHIYTDQFGNDGR